MAGEDPSDSGIAPLLAPPAGVSVPTDDAGAISIEAPCISCNYNLQGLTGLIVRCPECGRDNPIWIAVLPEHKVQRQMKLAETLPAACAGAVATAVFVSLLFLPQAPQWADWFATIVIAGSLLVASLSFYRFGRIATYRIAAAIVWRFSLASILILPGLVLGVLAVVVALLKLFAMAIRLPWVQLLEVGILAIVALVPGWLAYQTGKRKLKPFVRQRMAERDANPSS